MLYFWLFIGVKWPFSKDSRIKLQNIHFITKKLFIFTTLRILLIFSLLLVAFFRGVGLYVPYGWKVSALRAEKSKANFSFREANFSFRDRTVV